MASAPSFSHHILSYISIACHHPTLLQQQQHYTVTTANPTTTQQHSYAVLYFIKGWRKEETMSPGSIFTLPNITGPTRPWWRSFYFSFFIFWNQAEEKGWMVFYSAEQPPSQAKKK